jgi:fucose 4-O-acetylase-like acetyltransferase
MPLFFIVSGYLHKQPDSWDAFKKSTRKKTLRLLVPYVSFYFLVLVIAKIVSHQVFAITIKDLTRLICGGQMLGSFFASFWFVPVLFLTQTAFSILLLKVKNHKGFWAVIIAAYVLSYCDSLFSQSIYDVKYFWNADVVLLAIVFYSAGYFLKNREGVVNRNVLLSCSLVTALAIIVDASGIVTYSLNMRSSRYNHFLLDLLIPISMCILIIHLCRFIENFGFSQYLVQVGRYSLTIMYLHLTINIITDQFYPRNFLVVSILGTAIPILMSKFIFAKSSLTKFLFLGELHKGTRVKTVNLS